MSIHVHAVRALALVLAFAGAAAEARADAVVGFVLVDADTDQDLGPVLDGAILDLAALPTANLALRAETSPASVGSVRFDLDGSVGFRVESTAPYALFGDASGDYAPWSGPPLLGPHSLVATPFSGTGATGTEGTPLTVGFEIVDTSAAAVFSWSSGAAAPLPLYEAEGLAVAGRLLVFGGFYSNSPGPLATREVHAYDPVADAWTQLADMPEALTHAGQVADGQTVYLAGGYVGDHPGGSTDHVWIYDVTSDAWTPGPPLPADRGGGALARVGRELHFFGGGTRTAGINVIVDHPDHWVLDLGATASPADDGSSWTPAAALPNPRNHIGGAALGGRAFAIGGQHGTDEDTGNQVSVDAYDPGTDAWTAVADLPRPLGHVAASTFVRRGRIVVVGGVTDGATKVADVIQYDPATDTWLALPDLPAARQSPVAGLLGDRMVVSGGWLSAIETTTWLGDLDGSWSIAAPLPGALGEVSAGIVGSEMIVVGEGSTATLAYDLSTSSWSAPGARATRPFPGNHHAAEVMGGRLYLLGGLGAGSEGRVQIYDPLADAWTLGAPMPFAAGSSASARIGGLLYVAGGIVGSATVDQVAAYDPVADTWTPCAPMPLGVNHAAAASDGQRLFVFGGRTGGNVVSNGFDVVQIYDPSTDTWESSSDSGSTLAPLPQARGGTGKAVYQYGEFTVMGGETSTGAGATPAGVYDRVDVYDPIANAWRAGTPLPTARHGIFPLAHAGRIYVAGGGVAAANSQSTVHEVYDPRPPACSNGRDDDGDGLVDLGEDTGCDRPADPSERSDEFACDNGLDDDGDGFVDSADPGCYLPASRIESPQCQDGIDNDPGQDALGRVDFDGGQSIHGACSGGVCPPGVSDVDGDGAADPDPECVGRPWRQREKSGGCGLGAELVGVAAALAALRRRRARARGRGA